MSANDTALDFDFITEAMPAFLSEADEQCEQVEQLLLQLEGVPGDRELLNALFRCAHTVKGSAGIFGLDRVVGFTHHVETLLDRLREGELALTAPLSTLLLQCNDEIRILVSEAGGQAAADDADGEQRRAALVNALHAAGGAQAPVSTVGSATAAAGSAAVVASTDTMNRWRVKSAFGQNTFRNGMDPLAILSYLGGLGTLAQVVCDTSQVPALEQMDPENCHLSVELLLDSVEPRSEIEEAFTYVRDECELHIEEVRTSQELAAPAIESAASNTETFLPAGQEGCASVPQAAQGAGGGLQPLGETAAQPARMASAKDKPRESGAVAGEEQRFIRVQADRLDAVINLLGELVVASAGAAQLARQTSSGALIEANSLVGLLIEEIRNHTLQLRMVPIGETFLRLKRVVRDTAAELGKDVNLEIVGGDTELDKSVVERIADPLMHLVRNALDHGLETPQQRVDSGKPAQGKLVLSACHESGSVFIRITDDGRGIQRDKVLQRAWDRGLVEQGLVPADADIDRLIFEPGFSTAEKVTNLSGRGVGMDVVKRNIEALRGNVVLRSFPGQGSVIELRLPLTLAIIDGFLVGVAASKFIFPLDAVTEVIEDRQLDSTLDARGRGLLELRGAVLPLVCLRTLYGLEGHESKRGSVVVLQAGDRRFGVRVDALLGQHQTVIKPLGRMLRSLRGMSGSTILANGEVALIFDVHSLSAMVVNPPGAPQPRPAVPALA